MQDTTLATPRSWIWGMKLRVACIAALVLSVGAVFAYPAIERWSSASLTVDAARLRTAKVHRGKLIRDVSVQGRVVAAVRPMLFSTQDGRVTTLVRAGDKVARGDVVAIIESPELRSNLRQEEATLLKLKTELSRQKIQTRMTQLEQEEAVDLARMALTAGERELRRAESAHKQNAISQQDFEKAVDDKNRALAIFEHKAQEATLKSERLKLELTILNHALTRQELLVTELGRKVVALNIQSPVDGVVGNLEVDQKSVVAKYQAILSVVDMSAYEIEATVPEAYADELAQGMAVDIDLSGEKFQGELSAISPEVESGQVRCRIRFIGNTPRRLRQNQRVTSRILLDSREDVLMVGRGPFMQGGSRGFAYAVEGNMAVKTPFEAGVTSVGRVEILAGLTEGQKIVISSVDIFNGHERVYLTNTEH